MYHKSIIKYYNILKKLKLLIINIISITLIIRLPKWINKYSGSPSTYKKLPFPPIWPASACSVLSVWYETPHRYCTHMSEYWLGLLFFPSGARHIHSPPHWVMWSAAFNYLRYRCPNQQILNHFSNEQHTSEGKNNTLSQPINTAFRI